MAIDHDHGHTHEDGDADHDHDHFEVASWGHEADSPFYLLDNIHLTSVGVDIGSSTSHLMFSAVHLQRQSEGLSSRFVVVDRQVIWKSDVRLTPYMAGGWIDAEAIADFVDSCYREADINRHEVDGGAVILTGEALKRRNARALGEAVAAGTGDFVCVSAGHHLEAMLTAHGSGSAELSATTGKAILCIDIGGGTTKFSLLRHGEVIATAAIALGGRMVSWDEDRALVAVNLILDTIGVDTAALSAAGVVTADDERSIANAVLKRMLALGLGRVSDIEEDLWLTGPLDPEMQQFEAITIAGGVAEYVYGRESRSFLDLGQALGAAIATRIEDGGFPVPVLNPGQGIRATVVGASQCSVQVSGSTVAVSEEGVLPVRNVPVVHPRVDLSKDYDAAAVAAAIRDVVALHEIDGVVALAFDFSGPPAYARLKALADGIALGLGNDPLVPAVVMIDGDIGASIGALLDRETALDRPVICLDNLELKPLEFVDIGPKLMPSRVFPVVIKSLLFGSTDPAPPKTQV